MRPSARVPSRLGAAIEGLAHGGEAPALRRAMTDFGSPWSGLLGRALKVARRFVKPAAKLAPLARRTGLARAWRAGARGFRAAGRLYAASPAVRFAVDEGARLAVRRGLPQLMSEESARLASLKPYSVVPGHAMSFRAARGARRMPRGGM